MRRSNSSLMLTGALLLAATLALGQVRSAPSARPNVILVYVDDLARGDVGAFGCPDPGTEQIDRLAAQGMRLLNAYTHNAPCSPSRTALMMGMSTQRFGKYGLSRGVPIPADKPTLAETLRDAGYHTGFVGHEKWDIGRWDQGAMDRGFVESAKQPPRVPREDDPFQHRSWYRDVRGDYLTEIEGDYVVDFIARHGRTETPFFLYYTPLAVHVPLHEVPEKYLERLYPDHQGEHPPRHFLRASLLALDLQIGRMLDQLDEMGIAERTLVLFSSDNGGDPAMQHRPLPYRGGKRGPQRANLQWEGNYRMPTLVAWPGRLPAGGTDAGMSSTIDFYATVVAAAGATLPRHCEGIDLLPRLTGEVAADPERTLCWNTHGSEIVRWRQWRLVRFRGGGWRLYDIEADPRETQDVAREHPAIVADLRARYERWLAGMAEPAAPQRPPQAWLHHTAQGNHARRPFGYGWIDVETWDQIKDDPTQWSEYHVRQRLAQP